MCYQNGAPMELWLFAASFCFQWSSGNPWPVFAFNGALVIRGQFLLSMELWLFATSFSFQWSSGNPWPVFAFNGALVIRNQF